MERTCIVIGEDNLLIESSELLIHRGYKINAIISSVHSIYLWSQKNNIPYFSSIDEYIAQEPVIVDYLFSIVNSTILKKRHLNYVKKAAFNYHDSLLPSYAGLNATVWSILNNEKKHGITWHLINTTIDSGDIVYQKEFLLSDETVLNLNLRCFEEAILGLTQILDDIQSNTLKIYTQSEFNRSYFGKAHILPNLGFIDWKNSASSIYQYYKALAHGHYDNKVGTLKFIVNKNYLVISEMELTDHSIRDAHPGELIAQSERGIEVATGKSSVIIKECRLPTGRLLSGIECAKEFNLFVGLCLESLDSKFLEDYYSSYGQALIQESFWIEQFKLVDDHNLYSERAYDEQSEMKRLGIVSLQNCTALINQYGLLECFISFIFIYLYRMNDYEPCSCFLLNQTHLKPSFPIEQLFSNKWPLVSAFKAEDNFAKVFEMMSEQLKNLNQKGIYLNDLFARYPVLEEISIEPVITLSLGSFTKNELKDSILHFELDENSLEINIFHKINPDYQEGELKPLLDNLSWHFSKIIEVALENPLVHINEFELISDFERSQLYSWGKGKIRQLPSDSIYDLFKKSATLRPESVAIYEGGVHVTYAELLEKAEQIAAYIKSLTLPPQTPIAIYMGRAKEMLFAVLGILAADCIYVPIDKKYPINKINFIIENAAINYIFTRDECSEPIKIHYQHHPKMRICSLSEILSKSNNSFLREQLNNTYEPKEKIAYIMFTSGTTGMPKGVVISHQNVINYCYWFTQTTFFNEQSIIDFSSSLAFDLSIPCTLAPLMFGGALVVCTEEQKINPELYLEYLKNNKITHAELTPSYLEQLLHYPEQIKKLHHLNYLLLGADTVHSEEVKQWLKYSPNCMVVNEYGPTETTVSVTSYFVDSLNSLNSAVVPIGSPAFNCTSYLFDRYMNLCPIGMRGELCIGGYQVALGYLKNEEFTKKKFITVDFNGNDILYKTGDLASWLPAGVLQFFGRNDHQVKIHGYRVELPAIESILIKHDQIIQAVVVIRKQAKNQHFLRAYLVVENETITKSDIKQFLAQYLPTYMHPKEFCIIDSIPLKENEKINFDLLEIQSNFLSSSEYSEGNQQLSEMEQVCLFCWQESFHLQNIQLDEDFFALGGDSLIALHIIMQLKNKTQQDLHLSLLFKYPTIRTLAAYLEGNDKNIFFNQKKSSCLIQLSSGIYENPLFIVHPVGGTVFWYQQLAQEMKGFLTLYGIEDPCINNKKLCFSSLSEMADYYVDAIIETCFNDSIQLGGASFGANLAFEISKKLLAQGKKISFLGFFDGWAEYPKELMTQNTVEHLIQHRVDLLSVDSDYLKTLEDHRRVLLAKHKMGSIKCDVHLFKARELWAPFAQSNLEDNGWKDYVDGQVVVHSVPGNHETMFFSPEVNYLAELIKKLLLNR